MTYIYTLQAFEFKRTACFVEYVAVAFFVHVISRRDFPAGIKLPRTVSIEKALNILAETPGRPWEIHVDMCLANKVHFVDCELAWN